MSIPKEPRQLMINLMYLVLMALLALNVSAKIFKAFEKVDHSLERSNDKLLASNTGSLPQAIRDAAKKSKEYEKYPERIDPLRQMTKEFVEYVDGIIEKLIDEGGNKNGEVDEGDYVERGGHMELKGKKDKSIPTRLLVGDVNDETDGMGDELKQKIEEMVANYGQFFDEEDQERAAEYVSLDISEDMEGVEKDEKIKTWAQYNFNQMPIQATLPIFRKLQNDAIATENAILNYFNDKVGGKEIVLNKFEVVSSPDKTYVIQGEQFSTNVFLSAAAGETSNAEISISVNGSPVPVNEDGVATWTQSANSPGKKTYSARISVYNPVTDSTQVFNRDFEYEVGLRSVAVSADKMNVFYIGVDNPISISAAGVPTASLRVSTAGDGGLTLSGTGTNRVAKVTTPTGAEKFAYVVVSGEGLEPTRFPFRVKRIPSPVAKLGGKATGGNMGNGEFKAQRGVIAVLEDFDFDARCDIMGFELTRQARNADPITATNGGGTYGAAAKRLVGQAKPGDTYYFDNVKAKCPGDRAGRLINAMVFKIK